jgi:simple sugar transport system ATP-binding protein
VLTLRKISRRFGKTLALDRVDFQAAPGEIHAIVGENGAGKTTLMNVIAGVLRPDSGSVELDGTRIRAGSPHQALRAGIAAVHQSALLLERMTWEENLALGGFPQSRLLDLDRVAAQAGEIARALGFELPPVRAMVESRSVTERVRLEIVRALSFDPRVLILDEPTSVLAQAEVEGFLALIARLREQGRILLWITHKLGEAMAAADRITVMRGGKIVVRTTPRETSADDLARAMIGELAPPSVASSGIAAGAPILNIENLCLRAGGVELLDRISISVAGGEIVGIAGVDGNGQRELIEVIRGVRESSSGTIAIEAVRDGGAGLSVIPEDRDQEGLVLDMTLWENLILDRTIRNRVTSRGMIDRRRAAASCADVVARFKIRAAGVDATARSLSGGNRQRLAVARAIESNPRAIVAHNLTRGLDLAATAEVHREIRIFAASGGAVLLVSSDLDELMALCSRLYVINRGRVREVPDGERDARSLGIMMAGAAN